MTQTNDTQLIDAIMYGYIPTTEVHNAVLNAIVAELSNAESGQFATSTEITNANGITTLIEICGSAEVYTNGDYLNGYDMDVTFEIDDINAYAEDEDGNEVITNEVRAANRLNLDRLTTDIYNRLN